MKLLFLYISQEVFYHLLDTGMEFGEHLCLFLTLLRELILNISSSW